MRKGRTAWVGNTIAVMAVLQDYTEALKWYRRAAEQGHSIAEYNFGVLHYRGLWSPGIFPEAAKWYRKAADQGNGDAQFSLAAFYYAGAGC